MTDYYGRISALGICADIWFISAMYVRGSVDSNDLGIANKLTDALPALTRDVASRTYEIHMSRK